MTKDEFYDQMVDLDDLYRFSEDASCPITEEWTDDLKNKLDDDFPDAVARWYWYDIRERLNAIEGGGTWYRKLDTLEYQCIDDEFEYWRDEIADWCENEGVFDEPEEDEEEELEEGEGCDPVLEDPEEPEDFSSYPDAEIGEPDAEIAGKIREIEEREARAQAATKEMHRKYMIAMENQRILKEQAERQVAEAESAELSCLKFFEF